MIEPQSDAEVGSEWNDHPWEWTMYFNGEPMPRWSNCWRLLPILSKVEKEIKKWDKHDDPVGFGHFWRTSCSIDKFRQVCSQDPQVFRLCVLTFVLVMLRDETAILKSRDMNWAQKFTGVPKAEIFAGVRDGLLAMHARCLQDGYAIWLNGYEEDRNVLIQAIDRSKLPRTDPQWMELPHEKQFRESTQRLNQRIRRELISLLDTGQHSKVIRRFIHELPKQP